MWKILKVNLVCFALVGCSAGRTVDLADRVERQTWFFDCCNPTLPPADKELCKDAAKDEDHILWDMAGNKYVYLWSDCEVGKERWREWE